MCLIQIAIESRRFMNLQQILIMFRNEVFQVTGCAILRVHVLQVSDLCTHETKVSETSSAASFHRTCHKISPTVHVNSRIEVKPLNVSCALFGVALVMTLLALGLLNVLALILALEAVGLALAGVAELVNKAVALPKSPAAAAQGVVSATVPPRCDQNEGATISSYDRHDCQT